ncbi:MAG TPA: ABC transporter ATP-binding protein [Thermoanaerobaculia bacterium]|nr:ABC transporter ATP-binding protein [Thermoanaerobaculia bacterium]
MIAVTDVVKTLGGERIVDAATFTVPQGLVALLGRNGAGKSTLMRMLAGIWKPDSGAIAIGGHDLAKEPVAAKRLFGYLPEAPDLHPAMRGRDLLEFAAASRALPSSAVEDAAARFDARAVLNKRCGALSQGQRRLVTLLAATLHTPPILLLDEPTNALDPARVQLLREYLLSTDGPRAALISTHQLDFVRGLATGYLEMEAGKITPATKSP